MGMEGNEFEEKRKFVRAEHITKVKWKNLTNPSQGMGVMPDISKDISGGGVRLVTYKKLTVGDELQMEFTIPPYKLIEVRGQVRWVIETEMVGDDRIIVKYNSGIEFLDMSDENRDLVNKFVVQLRTM
jgi:c-di-GMP-binding flagellar brake protein YcgR